VDTDDGAALDAGARPDGSPSVAEGRGTLGAGDAVVRILAAVEGDEEAVVAQTLPTDRPPRRRLHVGGRVTGSLGSGALDAEVDRLVDRLRAGEAAEGRHRLGAEGIPVYVEVHLPTPELVVVGAGHIARPLVEMGALLDFRVRVLDDRPDFATRERFPRAHEVHRVDFSDPFAGVRLHARSHIVLVTRGHKYDYACLRRILLTASRPRYIGLIGSRRRVRATFTRLVADGVPRSRLEEVRAPLGLDLGAETPAEIAVAVAAELVLSWRGGSGRPLRDVARVLERFLPEAP
jgi:xanthine dehydrogenase accessory factor